MNGYDSVLLNTTVVRGQGRAPDISITKSAIFNQRTQNIYSSIFVVGYQVCCTTTELLSHVTQ